MDENGIFCKHNIKFKATTNSNHTYRIAPNLLNQDFTSNYPNEKWVGDIMIAFNQAYKKEAPSNGLIFHSDRWSQYAAYAYQDLLKNKKVRQSMSRKGNCYDNACAESFFATLKKDIIRGEKFRT